MFCANCGNKMDDKDRFCVNCGTAVEEANTVQTFSPTPQQAVQPPVNPPVEQPTEKNVPAEPVSENMPKNTVTKALPAKRKWFVWKKPKRNTEKRQLTKKEKYLRIGLTVAVAVVVVGIAWSFVFGHIKIDKMNGLYLSPIGVTKIKVGNWSAFNSWSTAPGKELYSSLMRYLKPVITYSSTIDEKVYFFVKIIEPNGNLKTGSDSPFGYSYSMVGSVKPGINQSLDLDGFGNSDISTYQAGEYTVEVWYNNKCLKSQKVRINY